MVVLGIRWMRLSGLHALIAEAGLNGAVVGVEDVDGYGRLLRTAGA